MIRRHPFQAAALAVLATLAAGRVALAGNCVDLPTPIYVAGSSAIQPVIKAMGTVLAGATPPVTLVYQKQGSCVGVSSILSDTTPTGACAAGACITGNGTYYDTTGTALTCTLDAAGQHVDVGVSDVWATSCSGVTSVPSTVKDYTGPIQAMGFVIPKASTQTALTAEEGYFVFGFGGAAGQVSPWLDIAFQFIRNVSSGTQQMTSRAIGIPAAKMKGTDSGSSGGVITAVSSSTSAEKTIGILGAADYDTNRTTLTELAFKAFHQYFAYYPDSSSTSFDKANVRDGHYVIWGPLHMLTAVDGGGNPVRSGAATFIGFMMETAASPPFDIVALEIAAHVIPKCAMKVTRTTELGDLSIYDSPAPCGCLFDSIVATTTCATCTSSCTGSKVCRHGYCEAK